MTTRLPGFPTVIATYLIIFQYKMTREKHNPSEKEKPLRYNNTKMHEAKQHLPSSLLCAEQTFLTVLVVQQLF
jgi:hypothetical protein